MNKYYWLLVVFLPLLSSCSKKTKPTLSTDTKTVTPKPTLAIEEIDFEYLQARGKMTLKDGEKERDVKAVIRVRKDSVIWMNFTVIGVQGGRALVNQDSITIISNVDKEYYVFDYNELSKRYNFEINYHVIQSALLGNLLLPRKEEDEVEQSGLTFLLKQTSGPVEVLNYISATSLKIQKVEFKENDTHNTMSINYANFQQVANRQFPHNGTISLLYKSPTGLLNTSIVFEFVKVELGDKELKFPFNIPKRYVGR